mgnify:FL=1
MPTIREVKTELRHREWAEQIQECQSSGMTVTAWCKEKGISQHTYYSRLNVVRKELLKRADFLLPPSRKNRHEKAHKSRMNRRIAPVFLSILLTMVQCIVHLQFVYASITKPLDNIAMLC